MQSNAVEVCCPGNNLVECEEMWECPVVYHDDL